MTDTLTAPPGADTRSADALPPASLRGPLLAAHRALRQSVNTACARCKGRATAAALRVRDDLAARDAMLRAVHQAKVLQDALAEFGGPQQIPQEDGFADYLESRVRHVQLSVDRSAAALEAAIRAQDAAGAQGATSAQVRQAVHQAQARFEALTEFAALFATAFAAMKGRPGS